MLLAGWLPSLAIFITISSGQRGHYRQKKKTLVYGAYSGQIFTKSIYPLFLFSSHPSSRPKLTKAGAVEALSVPSRLPYVLCSLCTYVLTNNNNKSTSSRCPAQHSSSSSTPWHLNFSPDSRPVQYLAPRCCVHKRQTLY